MADDVMVVDLSFETHGRGFLSQTWIRLRRRKSAMLGLVVLLILMLASLSAPVLTPHDPVQPRLVDALTPPNDPEHLLGTDHLGRDMLSRLLYGGRLSLMIGFMAVGIGLAVGIPLGAVSGFYGGWVDMVIQRVTDLLLSFPNVLLALSLVAVLGVGLRNVVISVGISIIPPFVRLVRASVLSIREQTYVEAARAIGARDLRIIWRHILVNAMAPVIVQATLSLGGTILVAAGLGFLGLGVNPTTPEWGAMMGEGRQYIFSASYMATFPGVAISLAVLGFNLLGDGLRDALDPHLRHV